MKYGILVIFFYNPVNSTLAEAPKSHQIAFVIANRFYNYNYPAKGGYDFTKRLSGYGKGFFKRQSLNCQTNFKLSGYGKNIY